MYRGAEILRAHPRNRLTAAVLFVDSFTGRCIRSQDLDVRGAEMTTAPVSKQDGWYLFLNYEGEKLTVTASGRMYSEKTVEISCRELSPLNPVVRIRLDPNRSYPAPPNTTFLEGRVQPEQQICVWCRNDPHTVLLSRDYSGKQNEIGLYDPSGTQLAGRSFALLRKGAKKAELFTLTQCAGEEEGSYLLTAPLKNSCKKTEATVFPVYTTQSDRMGQYFLLLPGMGTEKLSCRIRISGGNAKEYTAELEPGKLNRLEPDAPED